MFSTRNVTAYAKSLGYQGCKPVLVLNGKVVSHRNKEWLEFCQCLREQQPSPETDLDALNPVCHANIVKA